MTTQQTVLFMAIIIVVYSTGFKIKQVNNTKHSSSDLSWWETAVFYQIYPRSFKDTNGDGIGDLNGIIEKLDYLNETGITATLLSSIFKSPQFDQGYDVTDFKDIDPVYGTLDDFKELLTKAKDSGIKIIIDFVPNHTSNQHEWFQKSVAREAGYEDFYVWHDGKDVNGTIDVPNNWISHFGGSAWTWNEQRNQYYLHQYFSQQPDLNYSNPAVLEAMQDVLKYWLDIGVDGFRINSAPHLFEDPDFGDEPLAKRHTEYNISDYNCLDHNSTADLDDTIHLIYQWRELIDNYTATNNVEERVMITEAYSPLRKQGLYYGNGYRKGGHFSSNFLFVTTVTNPTFNIKDVTYCIDEWFIYIPEGYIDNWLLGNHDNHRAATRFGKENVDGFNMVIAFLPGIMVTYNGEEIGMEDGEVTCEQGFDPQATRNCSIFAEVSRDFERTPFQWDDSTNAGFTTGTPWLPVSSKAKQVNLAAQNVEGLSSHYNVYKDLLAFRTNFQNKFVVDVLDTYSLFDNVMQLHRRPDDAEYTLLFNMGNSSESVDYHKLNDSYEVLVASVDSSYKKGDEVTDITLQPHECIILRAVTNGI